MRTFKDIDDWKGIWIAGFTSTSEELVIDLLGVLIGNEVQLPPIPAYDITYPKKPAKAYNSGNSNEKKLPKSSLW